MKKQKVATVLLACLLSSISGVAFSAERIKDLAAIQGIRNNQLVGYGLVVGLDATGDQTTQTPFTTQGLGNMLTQLGISMPPDQVAKLQLKNVAAVMLTANLPPFAQPGQQIDVTVSSVGNAKSLRGGTLIMSQLKGADGQIYAVAQGNVLVGGVGAQGGGSKISVNHLSAGRIPGGATVERSLNSTVGQGNTVFYELAQSDFGNARKIVRAINNAKGTGTARALDARRISVNTPTDEDDKVSFLADIDELTIDAVAGVAKVTINPRTGSVVMNQKVTIEPCAIAHGSLSVVVSQPNNEGEATDIQIKQENGSLINTKAGANLSDVVKALNALGANPLDLLAILQAMKAAGALRAELEVL